MDLTHYRFVPQNVVGRETAERDRCRLSMLAW